jgi:hypothetical protein
MTEIREMDGERVIVTERGNEQTILALPPDADDALVCELLAAAIRRERDQLLAACDYIIMPDYPVDEVLQAAWRAYRQALRDIPEQPGFPMEVEWPVAPEAATQNDAEGESSDDAEKDESDDHSGEDPD